MASAEAARAVERAGESFQGLRLRDRTWLSDRELMDELGTYQVVCLGAEPAAALDYWAGLQLTFSLDRRARQSGRVLGLGFGAFPVSGQRALDHYAARQIEEQELLRESGWPKPTGLDFGYFRPLVEVGRRLGVALVALGAARKLVEQVASEGIAGLDPGQRRRLPALDFTVAEHRRRFEARATSGTPGGTPPTRYAGEVLRDETIADSAARFVDERQPAQQLLVVTAPEQCLPEAVPKRVRRRIPSCRVASVRPTKAADATLSDPAFSGFDYVLLVDVQP
jgi:hypothetical protein